jgi:hypothetical protein
MASEKMQSLLLYKRGRAEVDARDMSHRKNLHTQCTNNLGYLFASGRWTLLSSVVMMTVMMRQVIIISVLLGLTAATPPVAGDGNGDGDGYGDGAGRRENIRQATENIFPVSFAASPTSSGFFESAPVMGASASAGSPLPESSAGSQNGAPGLPFLANVVNVWNKMAATFYDHKRKV